MDPSHFEGSDGHSLPLEGQFARRSWTSSRSGASRTPPDQVEIVTMPSHRSMELAETRTADSRRGTLSTTRCHASSAGSPTTTDPVDSTGQHRKSTDISERHHTKTTANAGLNGGSEHPLEHLSLRFQAEMSEVFSTSSSRRAVGGGFAAASAAGAKDEGRRLKSCLRSAETCLIVLVQ